MISKRTKKDAKRPKRKKVTVKQVAKAMEEIGIELNERQKLFCTLYLSDKWCFANATQSYAEAYQLNKKSQKQMNTARQNGYKLLTNTHIRAYMDKMLEAQLEEAAVDKELARIVQQNKDLHAKNGAISEYNKLKGRIKTKLVDDDGKAIQVVGFFIHAPDKKQTTKAGR